MKSKKESKPFIEKHELNLLHLCKLSWKLLCELEKIHIVRENLRGPQQNAS